MLNYKVVLSKDAYDDIANFKTYILKNFGYREYAENFQSKIRKAIKKLTLFAKGYEKTNFVVEDMEVIIARVLKDGMQWQAVMNRTRKIMK